MANVAGLDRLKSQLLTSGLQQKDQPLYQVINQLIEFVRQGFNENQAAFAAITGGGTLPSQTFITYENELTGLPFSRRVVAGDGVGINNDGQRLVINSNPLYPRDGEDGEPGIIGPPGIQGPIGPTGPSGSGSGSGMPLVIPESFDEIFFPVASLGIVSNPVSFAYTPVWTAAGVAPALGNGVLAGSYIKIGKVVFYQIRLDIGSTTTLGTGSWFFSIPSASNFYSASVVQLLDIGVAQYLGVAAAAFAASLQLYWGNPAVNVTGASPFAWNTGDIMIIVGIYVEL